MRIKTVYAEITNQCNLNCRTCYNRSGLNRERKEISKAQLEHILTLFLPYGLERFLLSGGEPTLHAEFDGILELVDAYPQISFGIVTNGTSSNQRLIELLNTRTNFSLQISLDGSCEVQNAKTRGPGHFAKAIAFAKQIRHSSTRPLLKMVISQNNFEDIEAFYQLALSVGCTPEFAFIYKSGNGVEEWENKALTARQKLKALRQIHGLNQEYQTEAFLPLCTSSCPLAKGTADLSLCIKADGTIQPCQMLYDKKYSLGNAFAFDPDRFAARLNELCTLAKKRCDTDYGCSACLLQEGCNKGCMATAIQLHDDPLGNDGACEFRKMQFLGFDLKVVNETL